MVAFVGCDKDDDGFNYDTKLLHGEWRVTAVWSDGSYLDVTTPVAEELFEPTYITFNSDGTYSGEGYFGNGVGTYSTSGKTIVTFVGEEEYLRYDVLSLTGTIAEVEMYEQSDADDRIKVRVTKQ